MPVNFSIKNVPDEIAGRIRRRAAANHRSLQGELMAILEESASQNRSLTPAEILGRVRMMGLRTRPEATAIIRKNRNER